MILYFFIRRLKKATVLAKKTGPIKLIGELDDSDVFVGLVLVELKPYF